MANYQLYLGDCYKYMLSLEDNSIDTIVTSPPYNKTGFRDGKEGHSNLFKADIDYGVYDDNLPECEYWKWQIDILNEFYRILKPTGSVFYNHQIRRNNGTAHHPMTELGNIRLKFYQQIIWDRCGSFNKNLAYLDITTELILWFVKDRPFVNKNIPQRSEIWRIPPSTDKIHPASFPLGLPKNCILLSTETNNTIFDPFMGMGTTGVACMNLQRNFIGCEINPEYYQIAENSIKQSARQIQFL